MSRMIDAGMSVLGLYTYDSSIFDYMQLPNNVEPEIVKNRILMKCANLACMYTNPDFVKVAIKIWSESHYWTWDKLQKTTEFVYNPIWNKDGTITETHEYGARSVTENRGQRQTTENRGQRENTSEDEIAGFNSAEYSNADKSTVTDAAAVDSTTEAAAVDSTSEAAREDTITREEKGNIGITTTQQMIKEEREISDFSIYDYIAEDFKKEFCILVY